MTVALQDGLATAIDVLGLGIIAALNQVGIATTVTTPVLVAVLATVGGDAGSHRA